MDPKDPHFVLGIARGASAADIRRAYLIRAREVHPDRNNNSAEANAEFQALQHAYAVLTETEQGGSSAETQAPPSSFASQQPREAPRHREWPSFENVFFGNDSDDSDMFGGGGGARPFFSPFFGESMFGSSSHRSFPFGAFFQQPRHWGQQGASVFRSSVRPTSRSPMSSTTIRFANGQKITTRRSTVIDVDTGEVTIQVTETVEDDE